MTSTPHLSALEPELSAIPGTVSVYCARPDLPPAYVRNPDATHYAASTMKVAVMAAAYRLAEAGPLDLDAEIAVHADFASAAPHAEGTPGVSYENHEDYDNDPEPWARLGSKASLRWLVRRMIILSSNLSTNLVLERVGLDAVREVWDLAGARHSIVARGIEDYPAQEAGLSNLVTAYDLAALLAALRANRLASKESSAEMLEVLLAQEVVEDVVRGLPPGTRVAHKNGWVEGIRHSAALVMPDDAPEFLLVTCTTAPLSEEAGREVVAKVARAAWADRHTLA